MALSAELEALLSKINDDTVREATRKQLVENHENGLRQSDYSKKQNELKLEREKMQTEWKGHLDWYNTAKTTYEQAIEEQRLLEEKVQSLEAKKESSSTLVDELEIGKQLKIAQERAEKASQVSDKLFNQVSEIDKMIKDGQLITADKFEAAVNRKADGLANAILDVWEKQQSYKSEFGKDLPRQTLIDEAAKHNGNIELAYEALTKVDRDDKLKKTIEAEFEKKYQDRIRQAGLPIDDGGGGGAFEGLGALQRKALGGKDSEIPEDIPADGSGRLSYLIGKELASEGKG
jgi:hypothetical protein